MTVKTRAQLQVRIAESFPDNTQGLITPAIQRGYEADVVDSVMFPADVSSDASSKIVTSTGSTTPRTLADRFAGIINVRDYGAVGNGVTDDIAAFNAATLQMLATGRPLHVPAGNYALGAQWLISTSADAEIEIRLDTGARLIALPGFGASVSFINIALGGATRSSLIWSGGYLDVSALPATSVPPGLANNAIDVSALNIIIENCTAYAGTDWLTGGSDSGFFLVGGQILIRNCTALGFPDAGFYTGGGATRQAERLFYDKIICRNCRYGLTLKRKHRAVHIGQVQAEDCVVGVVVGTAISLALSIADDMTIGSIIAYRCETALEIEFCRNVIVNSVIAKDMGVKVTAGGGAESTVAQAVFLEGAQYCIIKGIIADGENPAIASLTSRAVWASSRTLESETRDSTDNIVGPIIAIDIDQPVFEESTSQVRNIYEVSHTTNVGSGSTIVGTGSYGKNALKVIDVLTANGLTTNLQICLDAADANSYTSGQSWLDRSGNGQDFFLGVDVTASATDPTFHGAAGGQSSAEYWSFDGGDYFTYDGANETWMNALHKDNAAFTILGFWYIGTTGTQGFAGTGGGGTVTGFRFISTSGGQLQLLTHNANVADLGVSSGVDGDVATGRWNFLGVSINEATGANGCAFYANDRIALATSTYPLPSAGNASSVFNIGARGGGGNPMLAGGRLGCICIWNRALTANEVTVFRGLVRRRYGV